MSVINLEIYSDVLKKEVSVNILMPNNYNAKSKILFLLHGQSNNQNAFLYGTKIGVYMSELDYFVIMPDVARSFYTNMANGYDYFTYLTVELPKKLEKIFNFNLNDLDKYVAGFSMGGYGAFKWALNYPNYFKGVASIAGALDLNVKIGDKYIDKDFALKENLNLFGESLKENDLISYLSTTKITSLMIQTVGLQDFIYPLNESFHTEIMKYPNNFLKYEYLETNGAHDWHYADKTLYEILKRFNDERK